MNRLLLLVATTLSVSACSPAPRSAAYFAAHRDEAAKIVEACKAGAHRGKECDTAIAGASAAARDARMGAYEKNF